MGAETQEALARGGRSDERTGKGSSAALVSKARPSNTGEKARFPLLLFPVAIQLALELNAVCNCIVFLEISD